MDYLFLRRKRTTATSERQKTLLFHAAEAEWNARFGALADDAPSRKVDCQIYKHLLYMLEIKQVFLDAELSLGKLCMLIETNQTYLSNVVNRYFGCNLKELINTYRVEYAKELLRAGCCPLEEVSLRSGFASKSAYYAAFRKLTGNTPMGYLMHERHKV